MRKLAAAAGLAAVVAFLIYAAGGSRSAGELLRLRQPAPALVIVMDASENLVRQQTRCVGCYRNQRRTETVSRTYTYSIPTAAEPQGSYIADAEAKFRQWVQANYTNPQISNLSSSTSVSVSGWGYRNLYISTAGTRNGQGTALLRAHQPVPFEKRDVAYGPDVSVPFVREAARIQTATLFPLTTWQAYHVFRFRIFRFNEDFRSSATGASFQFFKPVIDLSENVSVMVGAGAQCTPFWDERAERYVYKCKIRRIYPRSRRCTGPYRAFGPSGPTAEQAAAALLEVPDGTYAYAREFARKLINSPEFQRYFPGARPVGSLVKNYRANVTVRFYYRIEVPNSVTITGIADISAGINTIVLPFHPRRPFCVGKDSFALLKYLIAAAGVADPRRYRASVRVRRGGTWRNIQVPYNYLYYQRVRMPTGFTLRVTVTGVVSYDERVYDPCCWRETVKDKRYFIEFKNTIRDWIIEKKAEGVPVRIATFVSGGKASTGSVLLHDWNAAARSIRSAFDALQPAGAWAEALSVAEVWQYLRGAASVSRSEGAPLEEMNISPSPLRYSSPYQAWCQNAYLIIISAGPDQSSRSSSFYGSLRYGDYDSDRAEQGSLDWAKMADDLAAYYYNRDIRADLKKSQRARSFVITYKYSDAYHEHTAAEGGGRHFHATNPAQLRQALDAVLAAVLRSEASMKAFAAYFIPFHSEILPYAVRYGYSGFDGILQLRKLEGGIPSSRVEHDLASEILAQRRRFYAMYREKLVQLSSLPASAFGLSSTSEVNLLLKAMRKRFPAIKAVDVLYSPVYANRPGYDYAVSVVLPYKRSGKPSWWMLFAYGTEGSLHVIDKSGQEIVTIYPEEALPALKSYYLEQTSLGDRAHSIKVATAKLGEGEYEDIVLIHYGGALYRLSCEEMKEGAVPQSVQRWSVADKDMPVKFYPTEDSDVIVAPGSVRIIGAGSSKTLNVPAAGVYSVDLNADGAKDYLYITTTDGRVVRYGLSDGSLHTLLSGAERFSVAPTVSGFGKAGRKVFVAAVSGDYEAGVAGKVYGLVDDFSGRSYRAGKVSGAGSWERALPSGTFPMPWAEPVVFNAVLYVPLVRYNPAVPFCNLCIQADTLAYSLAGAFFRKIEDTLAPETVLHYDHQSGTVKGYLVSATSTVTETAVQEISAPDSIYKYVGRVYLKRKIKNRR